MNKPTMGDRWVVAGVVAFGYAVVGALAGVVVGEIVGPLIYPPVNEKYWSALALTVEAGFAGGLLAAVASLAWSALQLAGAPRQGRWFMAAFGLVSVGFALVLAFMGLVEHGNLFGVLEEIDLVPSLPLGLAGGAALAYRALRRVGAMEQRFGD